MAGAQAPGFPILDFSFSAESDFSTGGRGPNSTYQYCAVKNGSGDFSCAASSSAGTHVLGVLQTASSSGANTVRMLGLTKLVVDGSGTAVVPGSMLTTDATGAGTVTTTANAEIFAMALQGSTAAYDIISAVLIPSVRY